MNNRMVVDLEKGREVMMKGCIRCNKTWRRA